MICCKNCINWNNVLTENKVCNCTENIVTKFDPVYGEEFYIKDMWFHSKINKDGTCIYFEQKKDKRRWFSFFKKNWKNSTPSLVGIQRVNEFLTFVREKHPNVLMEYMMIKPTPNTTTMKKGGKVRPKQTPMPTGGLGGIL